MVSGIRAFVNYLRKAQSVPPQRKGPAPRANESGRTVTPILIRQAGSSNVRPLIKIIEHAGHQAVVWQNDGYSELPLSPRLPLLVFAELFPSKSHELEMVQALHQQIPDAKIILLVDPAEPDDQAIKKCAEQPGVYRVFKDPFNAGGLLEVVDKLLPPEPE